MLMNPTSCAVCGGHPPADHLTQREIEVLRLAATGMTSTQIGRALHIATRTVEQHVAKMLRRVGANSRSELISRCFAAGILEAGSWPPQWSGRNCPAVPMVMG